MSKATRGLQAATQPREERPRLSPSHLFTPCHPVGLQNSAMSLRWHFSDPRGLRFSQNPNPGSSSWGSPWGRGRTLGLPFCPWPPTLCEAAPG